MGFRELPLYRKLVIEEQRGRSRPTQWITPIRSCSLVLARVKKQEDVERVRDDTATLKEFTEKPVPAERLEAVKNHLRYQFALGLITESIAETLAHYEPRPHSKPSTGRLHGSGVTADGQAIAGKYFTETGRTIVTPSGGGAK
jgi:hypothetical protein